MANTKQAPRTPEEVEKMLKQRAAEIMAAFEPLHKRALEQAFAEDEDGSPKKEEFFFENVD